MDHQPEIRFQEDGTLDLSVFPDVDPDEALDPSDLESLHDTLVSDPVPELDQDAWTGMLDEVFASEGTDVDDELVPDDDPFVHDEDLGSGLGGAVGDLADEDADLDDDAPDVDDDGPFTFDDEVDDITDLVVDTAGSDDLADDATVADDAFADDADELADEELGVEEFADLGMGTPEFEADYASMDFAPGLDDTSLFAEAEPEPYELPEDGIEDLDWE
ncbi:MAG: hypothetical protein MUF83_02505 [Acidimicrobiales bacterium]|jgi:hypothetical protein|nr:hypothetical protein [Acidimicrobiales bacterium]